MPIAARYADVWHCFGPVEHLTGKSQRLTAMAETAGRDPAEISRAASLSLEDDLDTIATNVDAWEAAGFSYLVCGWPPGGRVQVEDFAARFLASRPRPWSCVRFAYATNAGPRTTRRADVITRRAVGSRSGREGRRGRASRSVRPR